MVLLKEILKAKTIVWIGVFCFFTIKSEATNFQVSMRYITGDCYHGDWIADVTGGIGPFTFVFSRTNGSTNGIGYFNQDTVVVSYDVRTVCGNYYYPYQVEVTDLSDGTKVIQTFVYGDHFYTYMGTSGQDIDIYPPTSCGGGCDGKIQVNICCCYTNLICSYSPFVSMSSGSNSYAVNGTTITNICPGTYTVGIDVGSPWCSATEIRHITIPQPLPPTNPPLIALDSITSGPCFGIAYASVSGGVAPFQFYWDGNLGGTVDSTLITGTHQLVVKDANGCRDTALFNVSSISNITLQTIGYPICLNLNDSALVIPSGGIIPYSYEWQTPVVQFTQTAYGLTPGTYSVSVTDQVGCVQTTTVNIPYIGSPHLYLSSIQNCFGPTYKAYVSGGQPPYNYLWSNGSTSASVGFNTAGIYTITVSDFNGCSVSQSVSAQLGNTNDITGILFQDINGNCIKDAGEQGISNAIFQAQPGNYFASTNDTGYFHLITDAGNYTISAINLPPYFNLNCTTFYPVSFGSYCNSASKLFSGIYVPNVNDLEIEITSSAVRPGLGMAYYLNYRNVGTVMQSGTVHLLHDTLLTMNTSVPIYSSYTSPQADFNYSNLSPGESRLITVYMNVATPPNGGIIGDSVQAEATIDPVIADGTPANNVYELYSKITSGIDPNKKSVVPIGRLADFDSLLTYTIQFQNTGNDTAFNIVIVDTLSPLLDLNTIDLIGYSHPLTWEISGHSIFTCTFRNILLPDSNRNELLSHGFVKYVIKLKQGLPNETIVENKADIYFDFNNPVTTNIAQNIYSTNVGFEELNRMWEAKVYPVPSSEDVLLSWQNSADIQVISIEIRDAVFRLVFEDNVKGNEYRILKGNLPNPGLYFYTLRDRSNMKLGYGKLIKVK